MAIVKEIIEAFAMKSVIDGPIIHGCCGIAGLDAIRSDAGARISGGGTRTGAKRRPIIASNVSGVRQFNQQNGSGRIFYNVSFVAG